MGIKNLNKLLKRFAPSGVRPLNPEGDLRGRSLAVDISTWLHAFAIKSSTADTQALAVQLDEDAVQEQVLRRARFIMACGAVPIFVFDGRAPECKQATLAKRRGTSVDAMCRARATDDTAKRATLLRSTAKPTQDLFAAVRVKLESIGFQTVQAPCEAEAQCAAMCAQGVVWAVVTEDTDALTFGAPRVIQKLSRRNAAGGHAQVLTLDAILTELSMTMQGFRDMCILCGCDYTGTVAGIGSVKACQYIQECGDIERALAHHEQLAATRGKGKKRTRETTSRATCDYRLARRMFASPEVEVMHQARPCTATLDALDAMLRVELDWVIRPRGSVSKSVRSDVPPSNGSNSLQPHVQTVDVDAGP